MKLPNKIFLWGLLVAAMYFILSYHFIFDGLHVSLLKKSNPTLNYTFFSLQGKDVRKVLDIEELREDGIADVLVERGFITDEKAERLLARYEETEEDY
ncbi:MAG: hypothetical protein DRG71_00235 [Deltaproteobacteria bacterium]|nr:MAG: hypothetical protein DRG71_00235 [Deltaproteobacteria bacterium]HDG97049.1 hypothetical protein [Desulfobacterales bacterium]